MQYKTKPQYVEAMEFIPTPKVVNDIIQFTDGAFSPIGSMKKYLGGHLRVGSEVLHVKIGDYVVRKQTGEFTVIGRHDFKERYTPY